VKKSSLHAILTRKFHDEKVESTINAEHLTRRTLIKLMALTSAGLLRSVPLAAGAERNSAADAPVSQVHSGRPRLFYNATSLKLIQRMLAADPTAGEALRHRGEELLQAEFFPESVAEIGGGQQANYITPANQVADMGLTLGLLFHLTGEQKYAAKLRDALLYYANYVRWAGPQLIERIPPWHSELDTTTFSFGYSAGYDALHRFLSDADRRTIAEAMVRLAIEPTLDDWILPGKRIHSLDSMGHNWWGVCVAGGGLGALALLGDDPRAQSWIDDVDAGYVQWFNYRGNVLQNRMRTFERSGPSYEGVSYTSYGVSQYLHYRFAWQNTFPGRKPPRIEPLEHIASYFLQTIYPTSSGFLSVNFDDSSLEADSTATLLLLIACGLGTPEASRYLELVHTQSRDTLFTLLRQYPRPAAQTHSRTSCIYPHMGWAILRSSWELDATLLAMKSGYTWNHAHADAGSFILFKQGYPLIVDSGTCKYSRPEYSSYYRRSSAHNVILFDGQGQPEEDIGLGCKFRGHMLSLIDGLGLKYAYADATGPMARWFKRNYRHWFWSGDLILIVDDVLAHNPGQMDWLLHYDGESANEPGGGVRLKNGSAEAVVRMLYPSAGQHIKMGLADHNPDKKIPYLVFRPQAQARSRQFITAICLNPSAVPQFQILEDPSYIGVRIEGPDAIDEIYLSLRAIATPGTMNIRIGDFTTDAYLLHLRRPSTHAPVERYFVGDGSYLRMGDRSLIESMSKLTACWSKGDRLQIFSNDGSSRIQIGVERAPQSVRWNGKYVSAPYAKHRKLVSLHRSSS
jgi:oligo-alginate lyase